MSGGNPVYTKVDDELADVEGDIETKLTPVRETINRDCEGTESCNDGMRWLRKVACLDDNCTGFGFGYHDGAVSSHGHMRCR